MNVVEFVKNQNIPLPRRRYRKLTGELFERDTNPDPDADKAGMAFFTVSSMFTYKTQPIKA
jgi:hypothetical protein